MPGKLWSMLPFPDNKKLFYLLWITDTFACTDAEVTYICQWINVKKETSQHVRYNRAKDEKEREKTLSKSSRT